MRTLIQGKYAIKDGIKVLGLHTTYPSPPFCFQEPLFSSRMYHRLHFRVDPNHPGVKVRMILH